MPLLFGVLGGIRQDPLDNHLRQVLDRREPFEIHFYGLVDSWAHWLLLGVDAVNDAVRILHREIYSGILAPYQRKDLPFDPHMGQGIFAEDNIDPFSPAQVGLNENEFRNALQEARALDLDFRYRMEVLVLRICKNDVQEAPVTIRKYSMA